MWKGKVGGADHGLANLARPPTDFKLMIRVTYRWALKAVMYVLALY